jgi:hypothetical protein
MRDGSRFYVYSVDAQAIAEQMAIIAQRRLKAAAERENTITSKRLYKPISRFEVMPKTGVKPSADLPKVARRTNPFSRMAVLAEGA